MVRLEDEFVVLKEKRMFDLSVLRRWWRGVLVVCLCGIVVVRLVEEMY